MHNTMYTLSQPGIHFEAIDSNAVLIKGKATVKIHCMRHYVKLS